MSELDFEANRLECIYCKMVAIHSKSFKTYVCDDCYKKNQEAKLKSHGEIYSEMTYDE